MCYFNKLKLCFTDKAIAVEYKIKISGLVKRQKIYSTHERASFIGKDRDKYRENRGTRCSRTSDGGSLFFRDSFRLKRYTYAYLSLEQRNLKSSLVHLVPFLCCRPKCSSSTNSIDYFKRNLVRCTVSNKTRLILTSTSQ